MADAKQTARCQFFVPMPFDVLTIASGDHFSAQKDF